LKTKIVVEMIVNIPNEYEKDSAIKMLTNELKDFLNVGCEYYEDDMPDVLFKSIKIRSFHKLANDPLKELSYD
jgi:hypothetical protein